MSFMVPYRSEATNRAAPPPIPPITPTEGAVGTEYDALEPVPFTENIWFSAIVGVLVVANLEFLALQADYGCWTCMDGGGPAWIILDQTFTACFLVELVVRIFAYGPRRYFRGDPMIHKLGCDTLHCLDVIVVFLRVLDVWILSPQGIVSGLKLFSAFRVIQFGRFVKRLRLIRALRELWLIMAGMADTLKSVFWVLILLIILLEVFAILFTIAVGKTATVYNFSSAVWAKSDYWDTVPKSMYALCQVLTLDSWGSISWPLVKKDTWVILLLVVFMNFGFFALLNTIVGVIVESTLNIARANEEKEHREKQAIDTQVLASLKKIIQEADTDGTGDLDRAELHAMMKNTRVKDRLKMLDIAAKDLDLLFTLLDDEGTGFIKTEMFFRGACRLRGPALASDLHQMSIDLNRNIGWNQGIIEHMEDVNRFLGDLLDHVDMVDVDIIRDGVDEKDPVLMARRNRVTGPKSMKVRSHMKAVHAHNMAMPGAINDISDDESDRVYSKQSIRQTSKASKTPSLVRHTLRTTSKSIPEMHAFFKEDVLRRQGRSNVTESNEPPVTTEPPPAPIFFEPPPLR